MSRSLHGLSKIRSSLVSRRMAIAILSAATVIAVALPDMPASAASTRSLAAARRVPSAVRPRSPHAATGTIEGTVTDNTGTALAGICVEAESATGGEGFGFAESASDGT
jgi:hypothetical protein